MSDHDHDHGHDESCPPHPHLHMPPEAAAALAAALGAGHEGHAMRATADRMRIEAFIDGLDASQCMALRQILNHPKPRTAREFVDGQVHHHMRVVLGVDPGTGEPLLPEGEQG